MLRKDPLRRLRWDVVPWAKATWVVIQRVPRSGNYN